jgi:N-glycosylase/DNA lyase
VFQIATRYLMPELAGMSLTSKLGKRVCNVFVAKYGKYAGWAQNVLSIGELSSQKGDAAPRTAKAVKRKRATEDLAISEDPEGN